MNNISKAQALCLCLLLSPFYHTHSSTSSPSKSKIYQRSQLHHVKSEHRLDIRETVTIGTDDMEGLGKSFESFLEEQNKNPEITKHYNEMQRKFSLSSYYKEQYSTSQVFEQHQSEDSSGKFIFIKECYELMKRNKSPLLSLSKNPGSAKFFDRMARAYSSAKSDIEERLDMMRWSGASPAQTRYTGPRGLCITVEMYKRREGVYDLVSSLSIPKK